MTQPQDELLEIADRQMALADASNAPEIAGPIVAMEKARRIAEKSSSGSWLGY
jgi:hypothetical protein